METEKQYKFLTKGTLRELCNKMKYEPDEIMSRCIINNISCVSCIVLLVIH